MENDLYTLLLSEHVTVPTRRALTERLNEPLQKPAFFTDEEFTLLEAICDRLIPQDGLPQRVGIAGGIDHRLSENKSDGWRYDEMPPDPDAYRLGLRGIDETATLLFGQPFCQLAPERQDDVLRSVQVAAQSVEVLIDTWQRLPADRFFEELLAEAVEVYYSHPLAQTEIHYVGYADASGWQRIGLNNLEEREKL